MIYSVLLSSLCICLFVFCIVELLNRNYLLKNFKFSTVTHPLFLDNFKTDKIIDDNCLNNIPYIEINKVSEPEDYLSIIISLQCKACEILLEDLMNSNFHLSKTELRVYIVPKLVGFEYEKISKLDVIQLSKAYRSNFKHYRCADEFNVSGKYTSIRKLADYTPKLVYNNIVLNYKQSINDLFFALN